MKGTFSSFYIYGYENVYYLFASFMLIIMIISIILIRKEFKQKKAIKKE